MPQFTELLDFAKTIAREAGDITLQHYQTDLKPDFKSDDSPVTIADKNAEAHIRKRIESAYPDHDIVGEEFGFTQKNSRYRWFIDPIDGTKSFICGVPLYAVLIGLEIEGRVEVGVTHFPALDEMVSAQTAGGCYFNDERVRVSEQGDLSRAIVAHIDTASFGRISPAKAQAWETISNASYYNAGWCDAYSYALVATGRADLALDPIMNPWDCGPFPAIFREAGGYFGDWKGNEGVIDAAESIGVNANLKAQILKITAPASQSHL